VAKLAVDGYLEDKVNFGERSLIYAIRLTDNNRLSASFSDNTVALAISKNMISELENTDRVGFEDVVGSLQLLVEKDFTCLDNVEEDQSDNYPNPLAAKTI
jgi:hypothetical protein